MRVLLVVLLLLVITKILLVLFLIFTFWSSASAQDALQPGWNVVVGNGQSVPAYLSEHPCALSVYGWRAESQEWYGVFQYAPTYVSTPGFVALERQTAYFVYCNVVR